MGTIILHICSGFVGLSWEQFLWALSITWVEAGFVSMSCITTVENAEAKKELVSWRNFKYNYKKINLHVI
jgi:putative Ca2+/H+ antiporter (TMEM165/GDT1 family)